MFSDKINDILAKRIVQGMSLIFYESWGSKIYIQNVVFIAPLPTPLGILLMDIRQNFTSSVDEISAFSRLSFY